MILAETDPLTGQAVPTGMIMHICVKCDKELTPEDPSNMPNLCDDCKKKGGGN